MEAKYKWLIGIGSVLALGATAFLTRDKWMPKKESEDVEEIEETEKVETNTENGKASQGTVVNGVKVPARLTVNTNTVVSSGRVVTASDRAKSQEIINYENYGLSVEVLKADAEKDFIIYNTISKMPSYNYNSRRKKAKEKADASKKKYEDAKWMFEHMPNPNIIIPVFNKMGRGFDGTASNFNSGLSLANTK